MKNLLYSLPEDLQEKIVKMNPNPIAELFNKKLRSQLICYNGNWGFRITEHPKLWNRVCFNSESIEGNGYCYTLDYVKYLDRLRRDSDSDSDDE